MNEDQYTQFLTGKLDFFSIWKDYKDSLVGWTNYLLHSSDIPNDIRDKYIVHVNTPGYSDWPIEQLSDVLSGFYKEKATQKVYISAWKAQSIAQAEHNPIYVVKTHPNFGPTSLVKNDLTQVQSQQISRFCQDMFNAIDYLDAKVINLPDYVTPQSANLPNLLKSELDLINKHLNSANNIVNNISKGPYANDIKYIASILTSLLRHPAYPITPFFVDVLAAVMGLDVNKPETEYPVPVFPSSDLKNKLRNVNPNGYCSYVWSINHSILNLVPTFSVPPPHHIVHFSSVINDLQHIVSKFNDSYVPILSPLLMVACYTSHYNHKSIDNDVYPIFIEYILPAIARCNGLSVKGFSYLDIVTTLHVFKIFFPDESVRAILKDALFALMKGTTSAQQCAVEIVLNMSVFQIRGLPRIAVAKHWNTCIVSMSDVTTITYEDTFNLIEKEFTDNVNAWMTHATSLFFIPSEHVGLWIVEFLQLSSTQSVHAAVVSNIKPLLNYAISHYHQSEFFSCVIENIIQWGCTNQPFALELAADFISLFPPHFHPSIFTAIYKQSHYFNVSAVTTFSPFLIHASQCEIIPTAAMKVQGNNSITLGPSPHFSRISDVLLHMINNIMKKKSQGKSANLSCMSSNTILALADVIVAIYINTPTAENMITLVNDLLPKLSNAQNVYYISYILKHIAVLGDSIVCSNYQESTIQNIVTNISKAVNWYSKTIKTAFSHQNSLSDSLSLLSTFVATLDEALTLLLIISFQSQKSISFQTLLSYINNLLLDVSTSFRDIKLDKINQQKCSKSLSQFAIHTLTILANFLGVIFLNINPHQIDSLMSPPKHNSATPLLYPITSISDINVYSQIITNIISHLSDYIPEFNYNPEIIPTCPYLYIALSNCVTTMSLALYTLDHLVFLKRANNHSIHTHSIKTLAASLLARPHIYFNPLDTYCATNPSLKTSNDLVSRYDVLKAPPLYMVNDAVDITNPRNLDIVKIYGMMYNPIIVTNDNLHTSDTVNTLMKSVLTNIPSRYTLPVMELMMRFSLQYVHIPSDLKLKLDANTNPKKHISIKTKKQKEGKDGHQSHNDNSYLPNSVFNIESTYVYNYASLKSSKTIHNVKTTTDTEKKTGPENANHTNEQQSVFHLINLISNLMNHLPSVQMTPDVFKPRNDHCYTMVLNMLRALVTRSSILTIQVMSTKKHTNNTSKKSSIDKVSINLTLDINPKVNDFSSNNSDFVTMSGKQPKTKLNSGKSDNPSSQQFKIEFPVSTSCSDIVKEISRIHNLPYLLTRVSIESDNQIALLTAFNNTPVCEVISITRPNIVGRVETEKNIESLEEYAQYIHALKTPPGETRSFQHAYSSTRINSSALKVRELAITHALESKKVNDNHFQVSCLLPNYDSYMNVSVHIPNKPLHLSDSIAQNYTSTHDQNNTRFKMVDHPSIIASYVLSQFPHVYAIINNLLKTRRRSFGSTIAAFELVRALPINRQLVSEFLNIPEPGHWNTYLDASSAPKLDTFLSILDALYTDDLDSPLISVYKNAWQLDFILSNGFLWIIRLLDVTRLSHGEHRNYTLAFLRLSAISSISSIITRLPKFFLLTYESLGQSLMLDTKYRVPMTSVNSLYKKIRMIPKHNIQSMKDIISTPSSFTHTFGTQCITDLSTTVQNLKAKSTQPNTSVANSSEPYLPPTEIYGKEVKDRITKFYEDGAIQLLTTLHDATMLYASPSLREIMYRVGITPQHILNTIPALWDALQLFTTHNLDRDVSSRFNSVYNMVSGSLLCGENLGDRSTSIINNFIMNDTLENRLLECMGIVSDCSYFSHFAPLTSTVTYSLFTYTKLFSNVTDENDKAIVTSGNSIPIFDEITVISQMNSDPIFVQMMRKGMLQLCAGFISVYGTNGRFGGKWELKSNSTFNPRDKYGNVVYPTSDFKPKVTINNYSQLIESRYHDSPNILPYATCSATSDPHPIRFDLHDIYTDSTPLPLSPSILFQGSDLSSPPSLFVEAICPLSHITSLLYNSVIPLLSRISPQFITGDSVKSFVSVPGTPEATVLSRFPGKSYSPYELRPLLLQTSISIKYFFSFLAKLSSICIYYKVPFSVIPQALPTLTNDVFPGLNPFIEYSPTLHPLVSPKQAADVLPTSTITISQSMSDALCIIVTSFIAVCLGDRRSSIESLLSHFTSVIGVILSSNPNLKKSAPLRLLSTFILLHWIEPTPQAPHFSLPKLQFGVVSDLLTSLNELANFDHYKKLILSNHTSYIYNSSIVVDITDHFASLFSAALCSSMTSPLELPFVNEKPNIDQGFKLDQLIKHNRTTIASILREKFASSDMSTSNLSYLINLDTNTLINEVGRLTDHEISHMYELHDYHPSLTPSLGGDILRRYKNAYKSLEQDVGSGMINPSNICYIHSCIQQLFNNVDFFDGLFSIDVDQLSKDLDTNIEELFTYQFQYMAYTWIHSPFSYFSALENILKLKNNFGEPIDIRQQQDAAEFYLHILTTLDEEALKYDAARAKEKEATMGGTDSKKNHPSENANAKNSEPKSWVYRFSNLTHTKLSPYGCKHVRYLPDVRSWLIGLEIDVGNNITSTDLTASLDRFSAVETLRGANSVNCSDCKQNPKKDTDRRQLIESPPSTLALNLKRFKYNMNTGGYSKLDHTVSFPNTLDINRYTDDKSANVHSDALLNFINLTGIAQTTNSGGVDVNGLLSSSTTNKTDDKNTKYVLAGVIVQSGSLNRGHYYTFQRQRQSHVHSTSGDELVSIKCDNSSLLSLSSLSTWIQYNDATVTKLTSPSPDALKIAHELDQFTPNTSFNYNNLLNSFPVEIPNELKEQTFGKINPETGEFNPNNAYIVVYNRIDHLGAQTTYVPLPTQPALRSLVENTIKCSSIAKKLIIYQSPDFMKWTVDYLQMLTNSHLFLLTSNSLYDLSIPSPTPLNFGGKRNVVNLTACAFIMYLFNMARFPDVNISETELFKSLSQLLPHMDHVPSCVPHVIRYLARYAQEQHHPNIMAILVLLNNRTKRLNTLKLWPMIEELCNRYTKISSPSLDDSLLYSLTSLSIPPEFSLDSHVNILAPSVTKCELSEGLSQLSLSSIPSPTSEPEPIEETKTQEPIEHITKHVTNPVRLESYKVDTKTVASVFFKHYTDSFNFDSPDFNYDMWYKTLLDDVNTTLGPVPEASFLPFIETKETIEEVDNTITTTIETPHFFLPNTKKTNIKIVDSKTIDVFIHDLQEFNSSLDLSSSSTLPLSFYDDSIISELSQPYNENIRPSDEVYLSQLVPIPTDIDMTDTNPDIKKAHYDELLQLMVESYISHHRMDFENKVIDKYKTQILLPEHVNNYVNTIILNYNDFFNTDPTTQQCTDFERVQQLQKLLIDYVVPEKFKELLLSPTLPYNIRFSITDVFNSNRLDLNDAVDNIKLNKTYQPIPNENILALPSCDKVADTLLNLSFFSEFGHLPLNEAREAISITNDIDDILYEVEQYFTDKISESPSPNGYNWDNIVSHIQEGFCQPTLITDEDRKFYNKYPGMVGTTLASITYYNNYQQSNLANYKYVQLFLQDKDIDKKTLMNKKLSQLTKKTNPTSMKTNPTSMVKTTLATKDVFKETLIDYLADHVYSQLQSPRILYVSCLREYKTKNIKAITNNPSQKFNNSFAYLLSDLKNNLAEFSSVDLATNYTLSFLYAFCHNAIPYSKSFYVPKPYIPAALRTLKPDLSQPQYQCKEPFVANDWPSMKVPPPKKK